MTAAAVLYDLAAAGVTIAAQGDRLRFWPQSAVGPDLLTRLKDHKAELLAVLQAEAVPPGDDHDHGDDAGPRWDDLQNAAEIPSCPTCPRLMTWQDGGGRWRCLTCDPPARSRRLADRADRLRHLAAVRAAVKGGGSFLQTIADAPFGNSQITTQSLATPDPRIIADPVTMCPRCRSVRVLPELQAMTGGVCWSCHLGNSQGVTR